MNKVAWLPVLAVLPMTLASLPLQAGTNEEAWQLYLEGVKAYEEERWNTAERKLNEAKARVPDDGTLLLNKRLSYRLVGVGRSFKSQTEVTGDSVTYRPNVLLEQVARGREAALADVELAAKRANPPQLVGRVELRDDDGDGLYQTDEPLYARITIQNQGGSAARRVELSLHSEAVEAVYGYRPPAFDLAAGAEQHFELSFTLGRDYRDDELSIRVMLEEGDGFSPDMTTAAWEITPWQSPQLVIEPFGPVPELRAGQLATLQYRLSNEGPYPVRKFRINAEMPSDQLALVNQQWPDQFASLAPGGTAFLNLVVKPKIDVKHGSQGQVRMVLEDTQILGIARYATLGEFKVGIGAAHTQLQWAAGFNRDFMIAGSSEAYVPELVPNARKQNRSFALVMGNHNYKNMPDKDVRYAKNDARLMKTVFSDVVGVPERNMLSIEDATYGDMLRLFGSEHSQGDLHKRVAAEYQADTVYVYYSGHGIPAKHRNWSAYLMPSDGSLDNIETNGYALDLLYQKLADLPAKQVVVFLDACFSGEGKFTEVSPATLLTPLMPVRQYPKLTIFSAAGAEDMALWNAHAQQGLFTTYLTRGLNREADLNGDRALTSFELQDYLLRKVQGEASRIKRSQTPTLQSQGDKVLVRWN